MAATDIENGFIAAQAQIANQAVAQAKFPEVTAGEHQCRANQAADAGIFKGKSEANERSVCAESPASEDKSKNCGGEAADQQSTGNTGGIEAIVGGFSFHRDGLASGILRPSELFPTSEKGANLFFGVFDGLRAIDQIVGEEALFVERELRGNAALGLFSRAAAVHQAGELLVTRAPSDGKAVESFMETGFNVQRGYNDCDAGSFLGQVRQTAGDFAQNVRMSERVQARQFLRVGKNNFAQFFAVDFSLRVQNLRAELFHDFSRYRMRGFQKLVSDEVGFDDHTAELLKDARDYGFAAGDSAGEADGQHELGEGSGGSAQSAAKARCSDGIAHEHGDGERADAAGNGSERAGDLRDIGMDVADDGGGVFAEFFEAVGKVAEDFGGLLRVGDAIDADVNDGGSGLHIIGFDKGGAADGGDENIGITQVLLQVARLGMADGDSGIGLNEQQRHGLAYNVAAADDHGVCAFDRNVGAA